MNALAVRPAAEADAATLAVLMTQLGYPSDTAQVLARLRHLKDDPDVRALVAERQGQVIGMIGLMVFHAFVRDEPHGYISSLVVDESARGSGAGSALRREAAHRFYESRGYEFNGRRYVKALA